MQNRPTDGIQSSNRIQCETNAEGKSVFREYWIHEWDGKGYDLHEHINDVDQTINRALELGCNDDAKKLQRFKGDDN